jgi:hypothetical protein
MEFSPRLAQYGFDSGFWATLNKNYGLLIDEYEGEDIPVNVLKSVANDFRFLADGGGVPEELGLELVAVASFLDSAHDQGQAVEIGL